SVSVPAFQSSTASGRIRGQLPSVSKGNPNGSTATSRHGLS
ncbi:hypothetical protein A2U01_0094272, partial [Trifolium medium]|nr:hypothetical protein [Trifolium medium]